MVSHLILTTLLDRSDSDVTYSNSLLVDKNDCKVLANGSLIHLVSKNSF